MSLRLQKRRDLRVQLRVVRGAVKARRVVGRREGRLGREVPEAGLMGDHGGNSPARAPSVNGRARAVKQATRHCPILGT